MKRIIVIEDEPSIRKITVRILASAGYEVLEASSGSEGLHTWREQGADLIVTDLRMSDMSGIDVIHELGDSAPDLPIIVVSGDTGGHMGPLRDAMTSRPITLLRKPFRAGDLLTMVSEALDPDPTSDQ